MAIKRTSANPAAGPLRIVQVDSPEVRRRFEAQVENLRQSHAAELAEWKKKHEDARRQLDEKSRESAKHFKDVQHFKKQAEQARAGGVSEALAALEQENQRLTEKLTQAGQELKDLRSRADDTVRVSSETLLAHAEAAVVDVPLSWKLRLLVFGTPAVCGAGLALLVQYLIGRL